jgi:hypothetical protein
MKRMLLVTVLTLFLISACAPTATPTPTATATRTATPLPPTATATVLPPVLWPRQNVECLGGPEAEYPVIAELKTQVQYNIIGMNADATHWIIALPESGQECWISVNVVEISGNLSNIPEKKIPSTPTPASLAAPGNLQANMTCARERFKTNGQYYFMSIHLTCDDVDENETLIKVFRDGVVVALLEKDITEYVDLPTLYPGQGTIHYQVQNIASDGHTSESADLHLSYVCSLY